MNELSRRQFAKASIVSTASLLIGHRASAQAELAWPPALREAVNGVVRLGGEQLLEVPEAVAKENMGEGAAAFTVAKEAPTVDLVFHGNLGPAASTRRLWSSWGDICLASDGKVYCAIGDHGDDAGGNARCFIYCWDPSTKKLAQVVDLNKVIPPQAAQSAWSKVHAKIDEGADGKIYFSCTLNDGNRAGNKNFHWNDKLPGGQLYQYDPKKRETTVFATLPNAPRCTATSLYDRERNVWWCNLETGANALWCLDMQTRKTVFQAPDGSTGFNRNFAIDRAGNVYFNGPENTLWKFDRDAKTIDKTKTAWGKSPGMRSSTRESRDGHIYGVTHQTGQIFCYTPAKDELKLLGPAWQTGGYVTVAELSPDERFVYYLPGAHGQAFKQGTPVIQYEIASGNRKVIAFLADAFIKAHEYAPAGTYGVKISADGATLFVNFNGHPTKDRPKHIKADGFGLTSFAAIQIPKSERS